MGEDIISELQADGADVGAIPTALLRRWHVIAGILMLTAGATWGYTAFVFNAGQQTQSVLTRIDMVEKKVDAMDTKLDYLIFGYDAQQPAKRLAAKP